MSGAIIWSLLTSRLAGPLGAGLAAVLAVLLAVALAGRAVEVGRADRLTRERDAWRESAHRWQAAREASEALRAKERQTAKAALTSAGKACEARIATARRSARAIQTIVQQEVPHDAKGCPARGLVPAERLRDALSPAG